MMWGRNVKHSRLNDRIVIILPLLAFCLLSFFLGENYTTSVLSSIQQLYCTPSKSRHKRAKGRKTMATITITLKRDEPGKSARASSSFSLRDRGKKSKTLAVSVSLFRLAKVSFMHNAEKLDTYAYMYKDVFCRVYAYVCNGKKKSVFFVVQRAGSFASFLVYFLPVSRSRIWSWWNELIRCLQSVSPSTYGVFYPTSIHPSIHSVLYI